MNKCSLGANAVRQILEKTTTFSRGQFSIFQLLLWPPPSSTVDWLGEVRVKTNYFRRYVNFEVSKEGGQGRPFMCSCLMFVPFQLQFH